MYKDNFYYILKDRLEYAQDYLIDISAYIKSIKFQDLKDNVVNLVDESKNLVVLNADENISHGYVISVLDVLRSIDGLKLAISTISID